MRRGGRCGKASRSARPPGFSAREKPCPQCAGPSRRIEPLRSRLPDILRTQEKPPTPGAFLVSWRDGKPQKGSRPGDMDIPFSHPTGLLPRGLPTSRSFNGRGGTRARLRTRYFQKSPNSVCRGHEGVPCVPCFIFPQASWSVSNFLSPFSRRSPR